MATTIGKPLTKDAVLVAAQRLMLSKGETSTLEVKMELRKTGFFALQDDVSNHMRDLAIEEDWKTGDNGHHRLYAGKAIQAVLNDSLAMLAAVNNGSKVTVVPTSIGKKAPVKSAPVKTIASVPNANGSISKSAAVTGDWETNSVLSGTTTLYFPKAVGRDKARSLYAKATGTSRNDARARQVK